MKYLQVLLLTDVTFLCYLFRSYKSSDSIWHRCCIIHSIKICIWLFVVKQRSTNGQTQLPLSVSSAAAVRRNRSSVFSPSDYRAPGRFKLTVMDNMISACKRKGRWRHKHIINKQTSYNCEALIGWLFFGCVLAHLQRERLCSRKPAPADSFSFHLQTSAAKFNHWFDKCIAAIDMNFLFLFVAVVRATGALNDTFWTHLANDLDLTFRLDLFRNQLKFSLCLCFLLFSVLWQLVLWLF